MTEAEKLSYNEGVRSKTWAEVWGNEHILRLLEVAAAGNHSVLFIAPSGYGKTMYSRMLRDMNFVCRTANQLPCL